MKCYFDNCNKFGINQNGTLCRVHFQNSPKCFFENCNEKILFGKKGCDRHYTLLYLCLHDNCCERVSTPDTNCQIHFYKNKCLSDTCLEKLINKNEFCVNCKLKNNCEVTRQKNKNRQLSLPKKTFIDEKYWNFSFYERKKIREIYFETINTQRWQKWNRIMWHEEKNSCRSCF